MFSINESDPLKFRNEMEEFDQQSHPLLLQQALTDFSSRKDPGQWIITNNKVNFCIYDFALTSGVTPRAKG